MKFNKRTIFLILGAIFVILCIFVWLSVVKTVYQRERSQNRSQQKHLPEESVKDLEFSPDGTVLAVATPIGIWIYDTSTYETIDLLTADNYGISSISFSPDGKTLAGGGADKIVYLWDFRTGKRKQSFIGHKGNINNVVFSHEGKLLASASIHDTNLWDVNAGIHKQTVNGYTYVRSKLWLNNDEMIHASAEGTKTLLSDLMTRKQKMGLGGHKKSVKSISFSPDGKTMASGSWDKTIRLWELPEGKYKKTLKGHKKSINSMMFSADGKLLASASRDDTARVWDVETGKLKRTFKGHITDVSYVALSPDGKILASWGLDQILNIWDVETGKHKKSITVHIAPKG
ncbi:WD40 repeat domain-containing protein [Candidatus Poribacteria bacterium]|nr:WD40 repeat domain-containing protein [Candidatus Poribacteria bacterium]